MDTEGKRIQEVEGDVNDDLVFATVWRGFDKQEVSEYIGNLLMKIRRLEAENRSQARELTELRHACHDLKIELRVQKRIADIKRELQ